MCGNSWKPARFPEDYKCKERDGILGLAISMCGNSRKPPWRFHEVSNARKRGGILGLTVYRGGILVETT